MIEENKVNIEISERLTLEVSARLREVTEGTIQRDMIEA
jgi:hypothetical protein